MKKEENFFLWDLMDLPEEVEPLPDMPDAAHDGILKETEKKKDGH